MERKNILGIILVVVIAALLITVGITGIWKPSDDIDSDDEIVIGAAISLSGKYADSGLWYKQTYEMWQDQVNDRGGLLGKDVKLILYDDQSDPTTGVSLYEKLITVDEVDCILGAYSSPVILATSSIAEKYEMLYMEGGGTSSEIFDRGYNYVFLSWPGLAEDYSKGFFELIKTVPEDKKPKTIGFLYEDTIFATSVAEGGKKSAEEAGLEVKFFESYPKGTTDFKPILQPFKDENVDIVYGGGYFQDSVLLVKTCKELNYNPMAIWSSVGPGMVDFGDELGTDADIVCCGVHFDVTSPYEGVPEFVDEFENRYNKTPGYHAAGAYATCQVLEEAINETESLDQKVLRDYVASHTISTILGNLSWDERGVPAEAMLTIQWQDGKTVIVWPPEAKTGEFVFPKPALW